MKEIPLTQNKLVLVSDEDYDFLMQWKWFAAFCNGRDFYAVRGQPQKGKRESLRIWMHREIMKTPKGLFTDHKNGNTLDNTRENLRICTKKQNLQNSRGGRSSTGYKGVYKNSSESKHRYKYAVQIRIDGTLKTLGYFNCVIEAAKTYDAAAKKYFGEFARPNFPDEAPNGR